MVKKEQQAFVADETASAEHAPDIALDMRAQVRRKEYSRWAVDGNSYVPISEAAGELPTGDYDIMFDTSLSRFILAARDVANDNLFKLPMPEYDSVMHDMRSFWKTKKKYVAYGYLYRRGILIYGAPGTGKSALARLLCDDALDRHDAVILHASNETAVLGVLPMLTSVRDIEPERNVVVMIEDIDAYFGDTVQGAVKTAVLDMLDANAACENTVFIATTSRPENVGEGVSNRPGRFDIRCQMRPPKMKARNYYLRKKMKPRDIAKLDMDDLLKRTSGFTIDHLKELVCQICIIGKDVDAAIADIRAMISEPSLKNAQLAGGIGYSAVARDQDNDM